MHLSMRSPSDLPKMFCQDHPSRRIATTSSIKMCSLQGKDPATETDRIAAARSHPGSYNTEQHT